MGLPRHPGSIPYQAHGVGIGQRSPLFQAQYLGRQIQAALVAKAVPFAADRTHELARSLPFVSTKGGCLPHPRRLWTAGQVPGVAESAL